MVALPTDVARSGVGAKRAFETVFKAMVSVLERSLLQNGRLRRTTAQSIAALSIGGMIVARTMVDRALADDCAPPACRSPWISAVGPNPPNPRMENPHPPNAPVRPRVVASVVTSYNKVLDSKKHRRILVPSASLSNGRPAPMENLLPTQSQDFGNRHSGPLRRPLTDAMPVLGTTPACL